MKNRVVLWCILLSVILIGLVAGTGSNAVSYWNEKCNTLYNQGNITGASDCWKKAIELGNQTNAPIFTEITTKCNYHMSAPDKNNSTQVFSKIPAEPISTIKGQPNPDSEDIFLSFDVTNPNNWDMRIGNIYVDVINYSPIANPNIIQQFEIKKTIGSFCNIEPAIGSYKCKTTLNDNEYIDIPPNKSEYFAINVNTDTPGVYQLEVSLDYVISGETNRITVGKVPGMIGFFDKSTLPA